MTQEECWLQVDTRRALCYVMHQRSPQYSTRAARDMGWGDWNECINKLDTRTKTAEEKDADEYSKTGAE